MQDTQITPNKAIVGTQTLLEELPEETKKMTTGLEWGDVIIPTTGLDRTLTRSSTKM